MSKGAISVEKQISVLNATIARLNAKLADATAEYKEYHRLFGIERKAKRKLEAQLAAVRELLANANYQPDEKAFSINQLKAAIGGEGDES